MPQWLNDQRIQLLLKVQMDWFVKSRRAQNPTDYETWIAGGVAPTLNAFDNATESRATVIIFDRRHDEGARVSADGQSSTLREAMGTSGNNVPVVAFSHTQGLDAQPSEEVTPTLRANGGGHAVAIPLDLRNALRDPEKHDEQNRQGVGVGEEGDPAPTVTSAAVHGVVAYDEYNDAVSDKHHTLRAGTKQSTGALIESTVRRLTPMECERLQGFPDNWTAERYDYKKQSVVPQADSARYKQMGNAVAVPVFEWVIQRLVAMDAALTQPQQQGGAA